MKLTLLKAECHRPSVPHAEPDGEGSCAIDHERPKAAGVRASEQVHRCNVTNGERFVTRAIGGKAGAGVTSVNGAAARRASPRDIVIAPACTWRTVVEAVGFRPTRAHVGAQGRSKRLFNAIPLQAA